MPKRPKWSERKETRGRIRNGGGGGVAACCCARLGSHVPRFAVLKGDPGKQSTIRALSVLFNMIGMSDISQLGWFRRNEGRKAGSILLPL